VATLVSIFGVGVAYMAKTSPSFAPPFEDTAEEPTAWVYAVYGAYWSFGGWQVSSLADKLNLIFLYIFFCDNFLTRLF
jgi:hypothetical protein